VIDYYLAVEAPPNEAADRVAMVARGAGLDLGPALHAHVRRFEWLAASGVDLATAAFATAFGRSLEYYSGLVFQIETAGRAEATQVAGGGRYDELLTRLGAPQEIPAIGSAIHTERLLAAAKGFA
ncbi:MAG: ATP phosphoribosyltransferase regulatory subunit, partial [Methyloceanibacter sp.]